jgi:hypothetical protein
MKSNLIVSGLALAAIAVVSTAGATQLNQSGHCFQPYNAAEATSIDYISTGVRTIAEVPRYVVASIDHNPTANSSQTIYIDGSHAGVQTTTCTVFSYDYKGAMLASVSANANSVSGAWERSVNLSAAQMGTWAYYSVLCYIPASTRGLLYGVTVSP